MHILDAIKFLFSVLIFILIFPANRAYPMKNTHNDFNRFVDIMIIHNIFKLNNI